MFMTLFNICKYFELKTSWYHTCLSSITSCVICDDIMMTVGVYGRYVGKQEMILLYDSNRAKLDHIATNSADWQLNH